MPACASSWNSKEVVVAAHPARARRRSTGAAAWPPRGRPPRRAAAEAKRPARAGRGRDRVAPEPVAAAGRGTASSRARPACERRRGGSSEARSSTSTSPGPSRPQASRAALRPSAETVTPATTRSSGVDRSLGLGRPEAPETHPALAAERGEERAVGAPARAGVASGAADVGVGGVAEGPVVVAGQRAGSTALGVDAPQPLGAVVADLRPLVASEGQLASVGGPGQLRRADIGHVGQAPWGRGDAGLVQVEQVQAGAPRRFARHLGTEASEEGDPRAVGAPGRRRDVHRAPRPASGSAPRAGTTRGFARCRPASPRRPASRPGAWCAQRPVAWAALQERVGARPPPRRRLPATRRGRRRDRPDPARRPGRRRRGRSRRFRARPSSPGTRKASSPPAGDQRGRARPSRSTSVRAVPLPSAARDPERGPSRVPPPARSGSRATPPARRRARCGGRPRRPAAAGHAGREGGSASWSQPASEPFEVAREAVQAMLRPAGCAKARVSRSGSAPTRSARPAPAAPCRAARPGRPGSDGRAQRCTTRVGTRTSPT